jgi:hypothetical protein
MFPLSRLAIRPCLPPRRTRAPSHRGLRSLPSRPGSPCSPFRGMSTKVNPFFHTVLHLSGRSVSNWFRMSKFHDSREHAGSDFSSPKAILVLLFFRSLSAYNSRRITTCERCRCERPAVASNSSVLRFRKARQPSETIQPSCAREYSCAAVSKLPEWRKLPNAARPRETSPLLPVSNVTRADLGSGNTLASSRVTTRSPQHLGIALARRPGYTVLRLDLIAGWP